jgi:WD40 repeat protein
MPVFPTLHSLILFFSFRFWLVGLYVASGSSSNGHLFVWEVESGKLVKQLTTGHDVGVCGCAWGCNGSSGQQVASVDKSGRLVLWA